MPIIVGAYIRPDMTSPVIPPAPNAPPPVAPYQPVIGTVLSTQRDYRFAGYHLFHDDDENTQLVMPPQAWLNQPRSWSRRSIVHAQYDLRAY